jgi:ABC-type ATPase with predicted acetyltransferase domain
MSTIDNLEYIKVYGVKQFIGKEKAKWQCPECGDIICCHNGICFNCGTSKLKSKKKRYRWEDD